MKLIVFSGLPGTGKSTLADPPAMQLGIPISAKDWLETALVYNRLFAAAEDKPLGYVGYESLSMLAERQRSFPGWHELEWFEVARLKWYYQLWEAARLVLEIVRPFDENLSEAAAFVRYNTKLSDKFSRRKP